jgi:hypothetical protein
MIVVDSSSPFERWRPQPEFSLAIFSSNCIDCATSLGPDRKKAYDESIRGLAHGGAVSEAEQRALLELGARGFEVDSNREFEKFLHYVRALHKRMLSDPNTSPVALAIVGVIANYAVPSPTKLGHHGRVLA